MGNKPRQRVIRRANARGGGCGGTYRSVILSRTCVTTSGICALFVILFFQFCVDYYYREEGVYTGRARERMEVWAPFVVAIDKNVHAARWRSICFSLFFFFFMFCEELPRSRGSRTELDV